MIVTDGQGIGTEESAVPEARTGDGYVIDQHHNIVGDFVREGDRTTRWK